MRKLQRIIVYGLLVFLFSPADILIAAPAMTGGGNKRKPEPLMMVEVTTNTGGVKTSQTQLRAVDVTAKSQGKRGPGADAKSSLSGKGQPSSLLKGKGPPAKAVTPKQPPVAVSAPLAPIPLKRKTGLAVKAGPGRPKAGIKPKATADPVPKTMSIAAIEVEAAAPPKSLTLEERLTVQKEELWSVSNANHLLTEIDAVNRSIEKLREENQRIIGRTKVDTADLDRSLKEMIALNQQLFSDHQKLQQISEISARMTMMQNANAEMLKKLPPTSNITARP